MTFPLARNRRLTRLVGRMFWLMQKASVLRIERPRPTEPGLRGRIQFEYFAALTILLTYGLIVLGGTVRATDSGTACPDWPLCHGRVLPADRGARPDRVLAPPGGLDRRAVHHRDRDLGVAARGQRPARAERFGSGNRSARGAGARWRSDGEHRDGCVDVVAFTCR